MKAGVEAAMSINVYVARALLTNSYELISSVDEGNPRLLLPY